jgi:hypothetical protein
MQSSPISPQIRNHPTIQSSYSWWILEGLPHIRTEASAYNFDEFLGPNPPERLPNLPGNPSDKARRDRKALQNEFDICNGYFIQVLKAMADNSPYKSLITPLLTAKRPREALTLITTTLLLESGRGSAMEIMDKYFTELSTSGRFPNQGTLDQDLTYAVNMINLTADSLLMNPLPEGHPEGAPHPDELSSEQRAVWLKKLLIPLPRFQPIFNANQIPSVQYLPMIEQILTAIRSLNTYQAYRGNPETAETAKSNHSLNEVSTQPVVAAVMNHQQRRSDNWRNKNSRYRSPTPGPYGPRSNSPIRRGSSPHRRGDSPHSDRSYKSDRSDFRPDRNQRSSYRPSYDDQRSSYRTPYDRDAYDQKSNHDRRSASQDYYRDHRSSVSPHRRDEYRSDREYRPRRDHHRHDYRDRSPSRFSDRSRYSDHSSSHDRRSRRHSAYSAESTQLPPTPVNVNFYQSHPSATPQPIHPFTAQPTAFTAATSPNPFDTK